jgi:cytochrome c peroxidase
MNTHANKLALGKLIFEDQNLSQPAGQSCASCHQSQLFYADPGSDVSPGANSTLHGNRNAPSISYVKFTPDLYWNEEEALWMGGFFLDGRAKTLQEQAGGPFLNPLEMGNENIEQVVKKVQASAYKILFEHEYGQDIWNNSQHAFNAITDAIVIYENGPEFALFNSKYDFYLKGLVALSPQEKKGLELFEAEDKGNCAACHPSKTSDDGQAPLFTDYSYDNLGQPTNPKLAFYQLPKAFNPQGKDYIDYGLAQNPLINNGPHEKGKFKVSSLRNIAGTAPYLHNGVFTDLKEVVEFYNERDVSDKWRAAEVSDNVNTEELGDLKLNDSEVNAIVAFLKTLTDGYELLPSALTVNSP